MVASWASRSISARAGRDLISRKRSANRCASSTTRPCKRSAVSRRAHAFSRSRHRTWIALVWANNVLPLELGDLPYRDRTDHRRLSSENRDVELGSKEWEREVAPGRAIEEIAHRRLRRARRRQREEAGSASRRELSGAIIETLFLAARVCGKQAADAPPRSGDHVMSSHQDRHVPLFSSTRRSGLAGTGRSTMTNGHDRVPAKRNA